MVYQIPWGNSLQRPSWEVAELHQTVLMSANKHPFVWHHTNEQFATWHALYTKCLKYFRNILSHKLHFPAEKQRTL